MNKRQPCYYCEKPTTKHTPTVKPCPPYFDTWTVDLTHAVTVRVSGYADHAIAEPFARLIAQAPAMLDALRSIEDIAANASAGYGHDPDTDVAIIAAKARRILDSLEAQS